MNHIYHGSIVKDLEVIKPFKRYTPGGADLADSIPARIYATYVPAYAVAHSFPWSSKDGIDILTEHEKITLVVPADKKEVLDQPICIYILPDTDFVRTPEEHTTLTYHSEQEVVPLSKQCFANVPEAMQAFGGEIRFV